MSSDSLPADAVTADSISPGEMLPADPDLPLIHTRQYEVRAFKLGDDQMLIRGAVRDTKPPGLYIDGDPDTLTMHHMIVELTVGYPMLQIDAAKVVLETHPHTSCVRIEDHYSKLVGLSIARGFTHKVRELFGGPRGCTHTTALLQAMAPVAVQCTWSMRVAKSRELGEVAGTPMSPEQREMMFASNLNTCHVWDAEGEHVAEMRAGGKPEVPIPVSIRLRELGREQDSWMGRRD